MNRTAKSSPLNKGGTKGGSLPQFIQNFHTQNRYVELIAFYRKLWDAEAWKYLKQNAGAVKRIKEEFTKLTGNKPYATQLGQKHWDGQIAKYATAIGVAQLILDMRAAIQKYGKINSIIYFLYSKNGAPRWEMLLIQNIEKRWSQEKQAHSKDLEEMAKLIDLKTPVEPDWVIQNREQYKRLILLYKKISGPERKLEIHEKITRIKKNLNTHGYQINREGKAPAAHSKAPAEPKPNQKEKP